MRLPRQGLGLGAAVALAAAVLSSCASKDFPTAAEPVSIPVQMDTEVVARSVDAARGATERVAEVVRQQGAAITSTKASVEKVAVAAEKAYQEGLQAKSAEAEMLRAQTRQMAVEIKSVWELNERLTEQNEETSKHLEAAEADIRSLQKEVGRAEAAIEAQSQIAAANSKAVQELTKRHAKAIEEKAQAEEGKAKAWKTALILGGLLGVLILLNAAYVFIKIQKPF